MGLFSRPEPEERLVCGKILHCLICQNTRFFEQEAQLNTAVATFLKLDWANKTGSCLVCDNCGYIHWFLNED